MKSKFLSSLGRLRTALPPPDIAQSFKKRILRLALTWAIPFSVFFSIWDWISVGNLDWRSVVIIGLFSLFGSVVFAAWEYLLYGPKRKKQQ